MQIECNTTSLLDCFAEMQLIFCKDNANRVQHNKLAWLFCRDAAYFLQRYAFSTEKENNLSVFYIILKRFLVKLRTLFFDVQFFVLCRQKRDKRDSVTSVTAIFPYSL